jgi:hypothetical protein
MDNRSDTEFRYITIDSLVYGFGLVYSRRIRCRCNSYRDRDPLPRA